MIGGYYTIPFYRAEVTPVLALTMTKMDNPIPDLGQRIQRMERKTASIASARQAVRRQ